MALLRRLTLLFTGAVLVLACGESDLTSIDGGDAQKPAKCQVPFVACGTKCVNLATDPSTCGACATKCKDIEVCSELTCGGQCAPGLTDCSRSCVDLDTDSRHCGTCDTGCKTGEVCIDGTCETPGGNCKATPMPETCDGDDNDCDDAIDEGCDCIEGASRDCGVDLGECHIGLQTCTAAGQWGACENAPGKPAHVAPASDICDGKDNDCDGDVDEGCDCQNGDELDCGSDVGACVGGEQTCRDGRWGNCENDIGPDSEICDGEDNDCDGDIDENCDCTDGDTLDCGIDLGECEQGTQTCIGGRWGSCIGAAGPEPEICDNLDNDCDGDTDEGCDCDTDTERECGTSVGVCELGAQHCENGRWGNCTGGVRPDSEVCDNLDNDCDGDIDENCECRNGTTRGCEAGDGVCGPGQQTCNQGAWGSCVSAEGPSAELCDGLDNDCDGKTDEDFALDTPCPIGGCPQSRFCSTDQMSASCLNDPRLYSPERCDGLDNDCNGQVDRISDGGSLRSICQCATHTLGIGSAVNASGPVNLCLPTQCGPDSARGVSIDAICWPVCQMNSDSDGDGWGFENGRSCIMPSNPRALTATPCDGIPLGMSMTYCLNCSGTPGPFAMCQSLPQYDLRAFARGERWLQVDYTYTAASAARVPINLWFHGGRGRKRFPLVHVSDIPGRRTVQLPVEEACFTPSTDFGSTCLGAARSCDHCGMGEACGAITECGDYDLRQAWLQVAAEFCEPGIGNQAGTITIHSVDLVEPNCGM